MPEQVVESIAAGFDAVLAKPFGRKELVGMAARILDPAGAHAGRTAPVSGGGEGAARILIADDDPIAREILAEFLSAVDPRMDLRVATDGREALQLGLSHPFGLIILDQNMPGIPGDRVIRALRTCRSPNSATPMMLISGDAAPRRNDAGAPDIVLPKPLDMTRFAEAVRRMSGPRAAE
jgi:CheY-like chemotaxis protein